jgi:hypothetical protein
MGAPLARSPCRVRRRARPAARFGLTEQELLHLTRASARRLHFAFAFAVLETFARDTLLRFPDELLGVLDRACAVAYADGSARHELERYAREAPAEGISEHVLIAAVHLAVNAPRDVPERSLLLAEGLALRGDLVALYRAASILRRLGRYEESLAAGMKVNDALITGDHPAALCEHLSERALGERHLTIELLDGRLVAPEDQRERPGAGL